MALVGVAAAGVGALPWPATETSGLLDGPDAGEWALSARSFADGRFADVDEHRLPTYLILITFVLLFGDTSIAQAGHAVNALCWTLLPFVVFGVARAWGDSLAGVLAGAAVLSVTPLFHAAARFGVDPVVAVGLPLAMLAVVPAQKWPAWSVLAGFAAVLLAYSHLTAFPYVIPAFLLLTLRGGNGRVWTRPLGFVVGALGALGLFSATVGLVRPTMFVHSVSEGIAPDAGATDPTLSLAPSASAILSAGASSSWAKVAADVPAWFGGLGLAPWLLGAVLVLGVLGLGHGAPVSAAAVDARLRALSIRERQRRSWLRGPLGSLLRLQNMLRLSPAPGLVILCCISPTFVFAAAQAEPRYSINLLPFVAILLGRGAAGPLRVLYGVVPLRARALLGLGAILLAGGALVQSHRALAGAVQTLPMPNAVSRSAVVLADAVHALAPNDSAVATPMREVAALLGRPHCPRTSCRPAAGVDVGPACIAHIQRECSGTGDIPLVWFRRGPLGMGDDPRSQETGQWAARQFEKQTSISVDVFDAVLILVPRTPLVTTEQDGSDARLLLGSPASAR